MIFFRDQDLTEDEHKAFGRRFGSLNVHPRYRSAIEGHPEIIPIHEDPEHTDNIGGVGLQRRHPFGGTTIQSKDPLCRAYHLRAGTPCSPTST